RDMDPAVEALDTGDTLADSFTVYTADGIAQVVSISINGVTDNRPPVIHRGVDTVTTNEDTPLLFGGSFWGGNDISVSDPDAGTAIMPLWLGVGQGTLALALRAPPPGSVTVTEPVTGDLDGSDGTMTLVGSLAAVNAALTNGVVYTPTADFSGDDQLF